MAVNGRDALREEELSGKVGTGHRVPHHISNYNDIQMAGGGGKRAHHHSATFIP